MKIVYPRRGLQRGNSPLNSSASEADARSKLEQRLSRSDKHWSDSRDAHFVKVLADSCKIYVEESEGGGAKESVAHESVAIGPTPPSEPPPRRVVVRRCSSLSHRVVNNESGQKMRRGEVVGRGQPRCGNARKQNTRGEGARGDVR